MAQNFKNTRTPIVFLILNQYNLKYFIFISLREDATWTAMCVCVYIYTHLSQFGMLEDFQDVYFNVFYF